ncbi:MAG: hypothetical protein HYU64_05660 [Armatimonadetes bacterium]|nr:hypothetical protein [Armatimonadota bacterium]
MNILLAKLDALKELAQGFGNRRNMPLGILLFLAILLLLPVRLVMRLSALPSDLLALATRAKQKRLEGRFQSEGRSMYPLW